MRGRERRMRKVVLRAPIVAPWRRRILVSSDKRAQESALHVALAEPQVGCDIFRRIKAFACTLCKRGGRGPSLSGRWHEPSHKAHRSHACLTNEPSKEPVKTSAPARRPVRRQASSCARRFTKSAVASTARDRRCRQSLSVCQRRGAPV